MLLFLFFCLNSSGLALATGFSFKIFHCLAQVKTEDTIPNIFSILDIANFLPVFGLNWFFNQLKNFTNNLVVHCSKVAFPNFR